MVAEAFTIRELTGSQRSVELRDRALPYRPIEWPGTQHYRQIWYPGNPVATLQVLGPREGPMELRGTWKDRFIARDDAGMVVYTGFDDLQDAIGTTTAEQLATAFARMRIAGNLLEVRWGPEVRRGILASFAPNYQRVQDIEWTAMFVWERRGTRDAPRAASNEDPGASLLERVNALDDAVAAQPARLNESVAGPIRANAGEARERVFQAIGTIGSIQSVQTLATSQFQQLSTTTDQVIESSRAVIQQTQDPLYTELEPLDEVRFVFAAENWRRLVGYQAALLMAAMIRARRLVAERVVPGTLGVATVRQNETLRHVALRFYANADDWTVIADANGLVHADVAPGTVVIIPRPPQSQSGTRIS